MADRFPLILNTNANQIQEIASGDSLDLTGTNIANAGIITAGNVVIGAATTDLIVNGNARVTGILTVGTSSLKLDGPNNLVNVGTALTLGHTQGLQFHTQNLHSAGFEVNQINASGIITATEADINGDLDVDGQTNLDNVSISGVTTAAGAIDLNADLDVDGHTNLDNLSVAGVTTMSGNLTISNTLPSLFLTDTNNNDDYSIQNQNGYFAIKDESDGHNRLVIHPDGKNVIGGDLDVDGHTNLDNVSIAGVVTAGTLNATTFGPISGTTAAFSGNVSVGGVLTYEDVTNVDSVGIVTARNGLKVTGGTSHFVGVANFNETIVGTARTAIKLTCTDESTDTTTYPLFVAATTGDQFPKTGTNLSFNSANGTLTATTFSGSGASLTNLNATNLSSGTIPLARLADSGTKSATTFLAGDNTFKAINVAINSIANDGANRLLTSDGDATATAESELTYNAYLSLIRANTDTNFTDNSAPGTINGMFINNSQSTNGVYSAISISANDGSGTNQVASLISKSVSGNYTPEFHITQRTGNNTTESNIKITSARSVELNHQGTKKLHTNVNGIVVSGGAYFNGSALSGTPKLYLYGYAGNDAKGVTIEGNEAALEVVSSADGNHSSSILLRNVNDGFAFINDHSENKLTLRQFTAVSDNFNAHGTGNGLSTLKTLADFNESGSVDLYWNNGLRIRTHEHGTIVKGGGNNVHIYLQDSSGNQRGEVYANNSNQVGFLDETGNWAVNFDRNGSSYCFSNFLPGSNDNYDLGATGTRWRNLYVNDLQLSNEAKKDGGGNDVDGTWGDYTIQEGESDLFLINNRSGKKYKFNLTEVS